MAIIVSDELMEAFIEARKKRNEVEKRMKALRLELNTAELAEAEASRAIRDAVQKVWDEEFK